MGYLPQCTLSITVALGSIEGRYDLVLGETKSYAVWLPPQFNTLTEMSPGEGYLIRMTAAGTLTYPACVGGLGAEPAGAPGEGVLGHGRAGPRASPLSGGEPAGGLGGGPPEPLGG